MRINPNVVNYRYIYKKCRVPPLTMRNRRSNQQEFDCFEEYPLLYVAAFKPIGIPKKLVLPHREGFFAGPDTPNPAHPFVPREVSDFYKENRAAQETRQEFFFDGWTWVLSEQFYPEVDVDLSGTGFYSRWQDNQRPLVVENLRPILTRLEQMVGKEIAPAELLPRLERNRGYGLPLIPDTGYQLMFEEKGEARSGNRLAELTMLGGYINPRRRIRQSSYSIDLPVGRLEYEGRSRTG